MKSLSNYLSEKLVIIPSQLDEKLVINKDYNVYLYHPETHNELRKIIKDRYDKLGPGTKQKPIDFNDIDVSKITSFYDIKNQVGIFEKTKFEYIDVSDWDVSNVKDMNGMFYGCQFLKELDLSNWDVSNVKNMHSMFDGCRSLKKLEIFNDILNVKYMSYMFHYCISLKELDLSNWDVSNVESMFRMFVGCKEEIIPNWCKNRK